MSNSLVFIDSRVNDHQTLIAQLPEGSAWFLLNPAQDGVAEMGRIASTYENLDVIHVISHGDAGTLYLGSTILDLTTAEDHRAMKTTAQLLL